MPNFSGIYGRMWEGCDGLLYIYVEFAEESRGGCRLV